jgi:hypothetical protein
LFSLHRRRRPLGDMKGGGIRHALCVLCLCCVPFACRVPFFLFPRRRLDGSLLPVDTRALVVCLSSL